MERRQFLYLSSAAPALAAPPLTGESSGLKITGVRLVHTRPRRPVPAYAPAPGSWSTGGVEVANPMSLYPEYKARRSLFALDKRNAKFFREQLAQLDLGLEDRMTTKIGLLSGGQRQAVALLMCTISEPQVLLLDEHTAALDPATAKKVLDITVDIVEETQTATMMITHDVRAALSTGNRTIMMDEGHILMDIRGEVRDAMTLNRLLSLYSQQSKRQLLNDRMLFELAK
jgi:putative ABC transport system ATP-binding protein